eukprot:TRINITY_DN321_c0_g1_i1.p2 TRINITY_DN321_c0_g1~~TRINITY_DN321_c0_g1_i1.p2  ORF type:complete len:176 (+),score=16.90 TRINITY_DN321_c0_g1_i1:204-731(+)
MWAVAWMEVGTDVVVATAFSQGGNQSSLKPVHTLVVQGIITNNWEFPIMNGGHLTKLSLSDQVHLATLCPPRRRKGQPPPPPNQLNLVGPCISCFNAFNIPIQWASSQDIGNIPFNKIWNEAETWALHQLVRTWLRYCVRSPQPTWDQTYGKDLTLQEQQALTDRKINVGYQPNN